MNVHYEVYRTSQSILFGSDLAAHPLRMYSEPQRPISRPWYCYLKTLMLPSSFSSRLSNSEKSVVLDSDPSVQKKYIWTNGIRREFLSQKNLAVDEKEKLSLTLIDFHGGVLDGEVCLLKDSPYRILRAAESGNLEDFNRLYLADTTRLSVKDSKGRAPVHQAAARNRVVILQFIKNHGGDLNCQDATGNTPLHIAIENDSLDAIEFLLQNDVDTTIQNFKKQAALHLATEQNRIDVLKIMSRYSCKFNPHQGGEHGRTALHLAAMYDFAECANILITQFGAKTRQPCNNGYYPIHEAAKNASSNVMEVFLQWGESCGNTREQMISFFDAEGNVPLHSAIHSGDFKAIELCLKSGAKISTQQHDMSTPVHLACSQGAIEIVKLMFSLQPEEKNQCLISCDVQKMTPLHCAAMFNRWEIVKYLIEEGADINALDKENRPPLLLAASRSGWQTVKALVQLGANIHLKDSNQRNILHLIITRGGNIEEFADCVCRAQSIENFQRLLDEKNNEGYTPLHCACEGGFIKSLESLLKYGACINMRNNNKETPLHLAAWFGRINILKKLLDSEKGSFIINEANGEGLTPLHIASKQGHTKMVQLLLDRGALLHRDHNGRNPLHLAAMAGYMKTIKLLHSVHSHLLDQVDKDKNTALHLATMENKPSAISLLLSMNCKLLSNAQDLSAIDYAVYYKFPEAALAMVIHETRGEEVMSLKSDKHPCVTLALIASMPKVFEAVQDKCISKANCKKDSKLFYIRYNFSCLQCPTEWNENSNGALPKPEPLSALNAMVEHGRVELLAHPLSQKYLEMKWNAYGKYFHLSHLLLYSIFLIFVTFFSLNLMAGDEDSGNKNTTSTVDASSDDRNKPCIGNDTTLQKIALAQESTAMIISALVIILYIALNIVRELIQLYQQTWTYLLDPTNVVYLCLYISATVLVAPTFIRCFFELQIACASITIFLSWFSLLLNLQRFDHVGIYVVMFLEILQTLIKVLIVFFILIVAFGLAFYILLLRGNHLAFSTVPMSVMRTFAMMLGEIDFLGTYVNPYFKYEGESKSIPFPFPVFCILGIFMILMPILLMNLLIGLAVGDIESVKKNAKLKRLAMQVLMHSELERKLPKMLLEKIDKKELIEYPNERKSRIGFLDFLFRIWFYHALSEEGIEHVLERKEDAEVSELQELKTRLKKVSCTIDKQRILVKLITEKMGIKAEFDEIDEGVSSDENAGSIQDKTRQFRLRYKLRSVHSMNKSFSK